jgi:hypothetical protein
MGLWPHSLCHESEYRISGPGYRRGAQMLGHDFPQRLSYKIEALAVTGNRETGLSA